MTVSRLRDIPGIGVNEIGDRADAARDPELLRLENLDTDLRPPAVAVEATRRAATDEAANSYLPFEGRRDLRAVAAALAAPDAADDVAAATAVWQQRCAVIEEQLDGYPLVRPHGGWSLLVDTAPLGLTPVQASARLFEIGRVAATPMAGWGPSAGNYLRLVFANEPADRLGELRGRFDAALGG